MKRLGRASAEGAQSYSADGKDGHNTRRRWRHHASLALATLVMAALTTACGAPHLPLSTGAVSACYRAIPAAKAAVHDGSARLVGVHMVPVDIARAHLHNAGVSGRDDDTSVCAIVLHGTFVPGQVTLAPPQDEGHYAVLLITSSHLTLLAAAVVDHVPRGFGRRLT